MAERWQYARGRHPAYCTATAPAVPRILIVLRDIIRRVHSLKSSNTSELRNTDDVKYANDLYAKNGYAGFAQSCGL